METKDKVPYQTLDCMTDFMLQGLRWALRDPYNVPLCKKRSKQFHDIVEQMYEFFGWTREEAARYAREKMLRETAMRNELREADEPHG